MQDVRILNSWMEKGFSVIKKSLAEQMLRCIQVDTKTHFKSHLIIHRNKTQIAKCLELEEKAVVAHKLFPISKVILLRM